jgi:hypothetical protein
MNPYEVVYYPEAEDDLALLWLRATDRSAVTLASELADRLLAADPYQAGTPLAEGLWAITVPPLRFYFEIDEAARRVEVARVSRLR